MANANANQPPPPPAWRARLPLNLKPPLHDLTQDFDKMLPKFEPSEGILVDDHLQSFYLAVEGLQAKEHEDVVCILFPHTLKGKEASWYFSLLLQLILPHIVNHTFMAFPVPLQTP